MRFLVALAFAFTLLISPASAQDGPRLSLDAVQAAKDFRDYLDRTAAAKGALALSAPPASGLLDRIYNTKALLALPASIGADVSWLNEWLGVAGSTSTAILYFGADPKGPPTQPALEENVRRYEDVLARGFTFILRLMPRVISSVESFVGSLPEADRNTPGRQQGPARAHNGYIQTVSGCLTFVGGHVRPDNARLIARALRNTVNDWSSIATAQQRVQLLNLLAQARLGTKDPTAQDDLLAISTTIAAMK